MQPEHHLLLNTAELAARPDFDLGKSVISPSARTIRGPRGAAPVEPRVMQVLVVLADARGSVVTRETLFRRCWGEVFVGDDSLNRAIAGVRRLAGGIGDGTFEVETVPRTGYRLKVTSNGGSQPQLQATPDLSLVSSRRWILGTGVAAAAAAGLGIWSSLRNSIDPRAAELIDRGRQALRHDLPSSDEQGVGFLRQAVAIEPNNAEAWGLLAFALRNVAENAPPQETATAVRASESAARRSLALDPQEGNALAALATVRPYLGDWIAAEDRLRNVLAVAPNNAPAMSHLVTLLQSVGRARDSWIWNERVAALEPLSPVHQFRKALKHWIFGRVAQADLTVDHALQLWPRHPGVWNARLLIFAFTGRPLAALAMLEDDQTRPPGLTERATEVWRKSLVALDTRSAGDVAAARAANLAAAPQSPGFALNAIMVLSMLGEPGSAFAVAEGLFLRRGPLIGTLWTGSGQMPVNDMRWRRTMPFFTPAAATLRVDPRFLALCEGIGLTDYWDRRRIRPDFPLPRAA